MHDDVAAPLVSVCILTRAPGGVLEPCLASLAAQENPPPWELVVASADPAVAAYVRDRFPHATVGVVRGAHPGAARNFLVEHARGLFVLFLDDDVIVASDHLARLAALVDAHPEVSVFGGPNKTPRRSSRFQFVQGAVLSSFVAAGPVRRRYGPHPAGHADERFFILCNLAVRRSAMVPFADELVCAEENQVLTELHDRGEAMYYDPAFGVDHERRPDLRSFAQQMHKYGIGRGQLARRSPRTLRVPHLVPSALVVYLLLAVVATVLGRPVALVPLVVYALAVVASAAHVARTLRRPSTIPLAIFLTAVLHACYGAGVLRGLVRRPRPAPVASSAFARAGEDAAVLLEDPA